ncbi:hypothetical protein UFOVP816_6 [uncultured Caudovirales phage]|uniref:Uncharacterized protein n=1 Tax=uncultured Caudovirales phage TaxID=2100421 RepID=A0A6J5P4F4_9CAUD|nr:hypothetical protein UFOVP816_6 [uncultured Caudovirales phage]
MSNNDGLFGWLVNLGALIFVGWVSHKQGYQQATDDIYRQASISELQYLREEVERLKRNQR